MLYFAALAVDENNLVNVFINIVRDTSEWVTVEDDSTGLCIEPIKFGTDLRLNTDVLMTEFSAYYNKKFKHDSISFCRLGGVCIVNALAAVCRLEIKNVLDDRVWVHVYHEGKLKSVTTQKSIKNIQVGPRNVSGNRLAMKPDQAIIGNCRFDLDQIKLLAKSVMLEIPGLQVVVEETIR
jgi:DNA gyrase/topoisomerase IV subunit B